MKFNLLSLSPDSFVLGPADLVSQFYPKKIFDIAGLDRKNATPSHSCNNIRSPWGVEIHLTSKCPLRCKRCSYTKRNQDQAELSPTILRRILNSIDQFNIGSIIYSGGGDPLAWGAKLFEIALKAGAPYSQAIATNGLTFEALGEQLLQRLDIVQVNVGGFDRKSYIHVTQHDKFDEFVANMHWLFKHRIKNQTQITGKVVIDQSNYQMVSKYLEFCHQMGFDLVVIKLAGNFEPGQRVTLNEKQKKEVRGLIYASPITALYDEKLDAIVTEDNYIDLVVPPKCWIVEYGLYMLIRSNGDVFPCVTSPYTPENSIGNLYISDLNNIWEGERHRRVKHKLHQDMLDGHCNLDICRHMRYNFLLDKTLCESQYVERLPKAVKADLKLL